MCARRCSLPRDSASTSRVHHSFFQVMPIPRADLALRREVMVLFGLCGVDPESLIFLDDVDLQRLQVQRGDRGVGRGVGASSGAVTR